MVPQIMIYGFLGLQPTPEGFSIDPKLPNDWPSLSISRIHLHDKVIEVKVQAKEKVISISGKGSGKEPLVLKVPPGWELRCETTELAIDLKKAI